MITHIGRLVKIYKEVENNNVNTNRQPLRNLQ